MGKPEDYVEKYLTKKCRARGYGCLKFTSPGTNGVPDRIIIANGRILFVETKRAGGKLRRLQEEITGEMRRQGADVRVADTRELVDDLLAELGGESSRTAGAGTPEIGHLLRDELAASLPLATPEQIQDLMDQAEKVGRAMGAGNSEPAPGETPDGADRAALERIKALVSRWESVPALRRGTAARELREALRG